MIQRRVSAFSHTGFQKEHSPLGNQDNIVYMEYNSTFAAVLTDGAQSAAHSGEGGLAISRVVIPFLIDNFSELWTYDEDLAKKKVWFELDEELQRLQTEYCAVRNEFGSTFLAICTRDDKFIAFHLGDGIMLRIREKNVEVLSRPTNGITKQYTNLTTSKCSWKKTRLIRGNCLPSECFILMSDGASNLIFTNESLVSKAKELIICQDWEQLEQHLRAQQPSDDWSFLALS